MPNWVRTTLTVTGPAPDVAAFVTGIKRGVTDAGEEYLAIFDAYYPTPDILHDMISPPRGEEIEQQKVLAQKYGAGNWYDWQRIHWGIKWGDCDTRLTEQAEGKAVFSLNTPWALATPAWLHISSQFPTLLFHTDSVEEGDFFDGVEAYQNNAIVETAINRPSTRSYWPEDSDTEESASCTPPTFPS